MTARDLDGLWQQAAADVYENDDALLVVMDMPGVPHDQVEVVVEAGHLEVRGRRAHAERGEALVNGHVARDFHRRFALPDGVDGEAVEADLSAGVLQVRVPKPTTLKPRRIEVRPA